VDQQFRTGRGEQMEITLLDATNQQLRERFMVEVRDKMKSTESIMQCILEVCELWEIEPEFASNLIDDTMKNELKQDAISLHYFEGEIENGLF